MLIEIDQVTETFSGNSVDISINPDLLDAITLDIFESKSKFKIYLKFDNEESNEKFSCHMCRLNETITYLDSIMTGFHKIDDILANKKLTYVNLSKIRLIKKIYYSSENKTRMLIDFIDGKSVGIASESEMEKLKQVMKNLKTVKKKVKMKY